MAGRELALTNLDKIIYPETGTTKADVLAYYAAVAPVLIPAAANRPATRKRWVNGVGTADAPRRGVLPEEPGGFRAGLAAPRRHHPQGPDHLLSRWSTIPPRSPGWPRSTRWKSTCRSGRWTPTASSCLPTGWCWTWTPARAPGLAECVEVASLARAILQDVGLDPVPVTSGSKGIHLYAGPGRDPDLRPDLRLRPRTGPCAGSRPPGPRRQRHEEDPAHRQGAGGLEPEQRRQDHHRAVLAARPATGPRWPRPRTWRELSSASPPAPRLQGRDAAGEGRQGPFRPVSGGRHDAGAAAASGADHRAHSLPGGRAEASHGQAGDGGDTDPRLEKYRTMRDPEARPSPSRRNGTRRKRRRDTAGKVRDPGAPCQPAALRLPAGA